MAMKFMGWNATGEMARVPLAANRFLNMMSELTIGWLLLQQAVLAEEKSEGANDVDKAFYAGKRQ